MIKYRPQRSTLSEAMKEEQLFNTIDEMYDYIVSKWNNDSVEKVFSKEDLSISDNKGKDSRIDWEETRYVCTKRLGSQIYDTPQCIGMCSIE